ncbi:DnaJ domain-containing protein [Pseudomaricurvus sp.]|uniref:DnaJ domain-containing protein n=1 Tax=Pseudomaricurvus sp. TaxID=2004510 RepID=UPI003F6D8AEB
MLPRLILLITIALVAWYGYNHFKRQPPEVRKKLFWKYIIYGLVLAAVALAATGKLHWIGALIAIMIPLVRQFGMLALRHLPIKEWLGKQSFANPTLTTRFIRMTVNMASGEMKGEILAGEFQGQTLDSLSEEELNSLLASYREEDTESARLLTAYIQRRFSQQSNSGNRNTETLSGHMDRHEALQILGLKDDANEKDIIQAHRKLMQKVHPDRGGSDYLAAKINQAKDYLLKG